MANNDRLKELFLSLVSINSPSKHEREVADFVKARLAALGFEVDEDDAGPKIDGNCGNVIAFKRGSVPGARSVFLSCHMDTVEPTQNLSVAEDAGVLCTDGNTILGADDKAGLAAVIEGITRIVESGAPHGDIQVICDVAEEIGLLGAKLLDRSRIKAEAGYVLDTGWPAGGITVSAPSHENITVEITGKAAHAGIEPEKGVSAILAASSAISKMNLGRVDDETTANIGRIEGGKARNIIPDRVTINAEARSRSEEKLAEQVRHMKELFEQEAAKIGASAVVSTEHEYTRFRWAQDDPVVAMAVLATRRAGFEPTFQEGGGGSDANVFNAAGVPSVLIGVGYENPHSPAERISVGELGRAADFVTALLQVAAEQKE